MNFIEIQSWPQIPSIAFFVSLFSSSFNLIDFDIEDLEEALLLDSSESSSIDDNTAELAPRLIPELIVSLLRGCDLSWPNITTSNYQLFLRRLFRHKCEEYNIWNPFNTDIDFHSLSLHTKVVILNFLCDFRLDSVDVESITNRFKADSLRIDPLGEDANGSVYWYFYGTRLYREDFKKKKERIWQVICFTEQDWQTLTNKFLHSKNRKEKALYKVLSEDFLTHIPNLFKAKEAERRRRLFQRRSSQRVKVILERRQQDRKHNGDDDLAALSEDDSDNKLSQTEKYLEEKQEKFVAQSKLREKIQADRALRAQRRSSSISSSSSCGHESLTQNDDDDFKQNQNNKENILHSSLLHKKFPTSKNKMPPTSIKLPGRQTNNSLSSITGQIVIQPPTSSPGPSTSRKKKPKTEVILTTANLVSPLSFMETDEVLQIGMHKVLQHVKNNDDAWPFMDPVEEDIAPRYYSIIKRPMDLLKMEEKLDNGEYRSFTEFRTDFKLIVNNCRLYNGQNNEYTEMVNNLQNAFDRSTKKYFDQTSSDEEPVLLEYPPIESALNKPNNNNNNNDKELKKEKFKAKEKKHLKQQQSASILKDDDDEVSQKKLKDVKSKSVDVVKKDTNKVDKEKIAKGVKRKHKDKDKDKNDKIKAKKLKKTSSDDKSENFDYSSGHDNECEHQASKVDAKKKLKSGKKENEKNENIEKRIKLSSAKNNDNGSTDKHLKTLSKKKLKKELPQKSEKFSKTNEKANNKKRKLDKDVQVESDQSDVESVIQDLIVEKKKSIETKKIKVKSNHNVKPQSDKKARVKLSTMKKSSKESVSRKLKSKKSRSNNDQSSILSDSCSRSRSRSPQTACDATNSLDFEGTKTNGKLDSSFRSDTPEIKDKFDLIKERRNKINQEKEKDGKSSSSSSHQKEKNQKLKETIEKLKIKNEKSKSQIEFMDEVLGGKTQKKDGNNDFDKLKNETTTTTTTTPLESKKPDISSQALTQEKAKSKKSSKHEKKDERRKDEKKIPSVVQGSKNKKQNKASLDVLDMETEQTLKDINKWLEHTPRFEYSSASNSPSRYIIDEIEMPSKMDDNDFRKPIPLMPSSPSASHTNTFQSPPKDFNLLKESNNNKQALTSQNASLASTSSKKPGSKEPKRKGLKEKLQQLPRKKEIQRTIDRLQPGKTKGNLLHNIQNINKPEELYPLGNREKVKEVKNSLIVQTDESSPKLSLGTVLDTQSFSFNNNDSRKQDSDNYEEQVLKTEKEESDEPKEDKEVSSKAANPVEENPKESSEDVESKSSASVAEVATSKPNLNAWFKAFGAPKKPKKSDSQEDLAKLSENEAVKSDGNFASHPRRLSTGSSMSERSSIEGSPQVGLEERLGAPAPYPSPIGASPIMVSPKTDDNLKSPSANYAVNGSIGRVGFYQDMTSTKSSPEKSCSPREIPSQYGQYSQSHLYSGTASPTGPGLYGNFYHPENSSANSKQNQQQASYSKPTTSPASYYDQYKQPMSQEPEFSNSMSPNTNPNSPYHSQQSSPYQQQPNSPFQSPAANTGIQAPNSPYSQPSSPYQQTSQGSYHQSSSSSSNSSQSQKTPSQNQPVNFNSPPVNFPQIGANFNQGEQFSQQTQKPSDWKTAGDANAYNLNHQQQQQQQQPEPSSFNTLQHPQSLHNKQGPISIATQQHQQSQQRSDIAFQQSQDSYNKKVSIEPQSSGTPSTTPLYGTGSIQSSGSSVYNDVEMVAKHLNKVASPADSNKQQHPDNSKYLDLSKHQVPHANQQQPAQYQQMFDISNYSKSAIDFDMSKNNKPAEVFNRALPKNTIPMPSSASCATAPGFWGNANQIKATDPNYGKSDNKNDIAGKPILNSILNNPGANSFLNNVAQHQQPPRNSQPPPTMDMNYKQQLFNNPTASSMMDLTAFMRDFRQAEERFSTLSNASGSFYDKPITPAHMFGKNLQQTNPSSALQQMFNSSISTMAYNREQQNMNLATYHNRLNAPQSAVANPTQTHSSIQAQAAAETKSKKPRKKKNASPDVAANSSQSINQHHQLHQAQPQQSFQSYNFPSSTSAATDSAIALKSIVPGSAFYGPTPLTGLYENPGYLDEFRGSSNHYYPPLSHRSTPDPSIKSQLDFDKTAANPPPPPAHPPSYHHLHPRSSYPFMNSIDLQQQYRMMLNQTYHPALGMHNQPHWGHHM